MSWLTAFSTRGPSASGSGTVAAMPLGFAAMEASKICCMSGMLKVSGPRNFASTPMSLAACSEPFCMIAVFGSGGIMWVGISIRMSPRLVSPPPPPSSLSSPPPQPAAPNSAAPATPTPPTFRKSLRLNPLSIIESPPSIPFPAPGLPRLHHCLLPGSSDLFELSLQVGQALPDVGDGAFAFVRLGLDHGVLFEHVPATVARALEPAHHLSDVHVAVAQRPECSPAGGLLEAQLSRGDPPREVPVHVLEVDVAHPVPRQLGDLDGIATPHHEVAGVQAQPRVATFEEAPELVVALDHGAVVVVQRYREAVPGADLLHRREGLEELPPRTFIQLGDLLVTLRARGRGQDHHVGASGCEELRALLDESQLRLARAGVVQHGGHEPSYEAQAVSGQDVGHLGGVLRQQ